MYDLIFVHARWFAILPIRQTGPRSRPVSVSGPKMYIVQRHPFMSRTAEDTQLYQIIHVDTEKQHYEAFTVA